MAPPYTPSITQGDADYISLKLRLWPLYYHTHRAHYWRLADEQLPGTPRLTALATTALSTRLMPEYGWLPVVVWSQKRQAYRALWPRSYTRHRDRATRYGVRIAQILHACAPDDYLLAEADWPPSPEWPFSTRGLVTGRMRA